MLVDSTARLLILKMIGVRGRSGNWGHAGRPGLRGGSVPSSFTPPVVDGSVSTSSASRRDRALRWLQDKRGGVTAQVNDLEACFEAATGNKDSWVYLQDLEITDPKTGFSTEITEITESYGTVHILGRVKAPDGITIGGFARFFNRKGEVHHVSFSMDRQVQGKGFGTTFYKQSEDAYTRMGMKKVVLFANINVGGYAWARIGFDWKYSEVRRHFNEDFLAEYTKRAGSNDPPPSSLPHFEHPWELATYQCKLASGYTLSGKEFLLGKAWNGVKSLDPNSLGYQVGQAYYKAKGL